MSNFKIVKCKKCDASLVELQGQKLSKCEQCNYVFPMSEKQSQRNKILKTLEISQLKKRLKQQTFNNNHSTEQRIPNTQSQKETKFTLAKKKTSVFKTLIKWYFIIVIAMSIISNFFK